MEFVQLKSFIKVAQLLNFSNAAEALGYSQSAVTIHIQQLEKELGVKLFERIGRKVYLSESGSLFLEDAMGLINQAEAAMMKIKTREVISGELRIGTVESLATTILTSILLEMHQEYPEVHTVVTIGTTKSLQKQLKNHEIDLMLTLDYPIYGREWIKLFERVEESAFVGSKQVVRSLPNIPNLKEIISHSFILTQGGASYRNELEGMLANENLTLIPKLEISNPDIIIDLVSQGYGLSFLPVFVIDENYHAKELEKVAYPVPTSNIQIQLIQHKNKQSLSVMQLFTEKIHDFFNQKKG
ncbi:LysR family transcriptional regulator [Vagococcus sp. DIV0080]|uniref:LysR family transcriptional regulator n=1 Tax=Candidatus Vagococcus giribetii TaxID=2230876 RepID=A0ABS3HQR6_9ENTE|nr:LysR family transcriptional regulator [Vagococcus sp. DIV0080]MBO0476099.1 LysR family transcriptional regulator [Vagococcus sp. DIV0080]